MDADKCRKCGSAPVLVKLKGNIGTTFYMCPKEYYGECNESEIVAEQKALKEWNERQQK